MSRTLPTLLAIGLVAVSTALLAAKKPTPTTVSVTTTVHDYNGAIQLLMRSDHFDGPDYAKYGKPSTSTNGKSQPTDNSLSKINEEGNWEMTWSSPRALFITPNQPVGLQPPPTVPIPPANFYYWAGQAHSSCLTSTGAVMPFTSLGTGITYACRLGVIFHYPDQSSGGPVYKLVMGPDLPEEDPATGVAGVVCNSVANNKCTNWTITPGPDENGQNQNVANLYYYNGSAGVWVFLGQHSNSFRLTVVTN